jgi:hypothetical protein
MSTSEQADRIKELFCKFSRRTFPDPSEITIEPIKGSGSDRSFYRVRHGNETFILMTGRCEKSDLQSYLEIDRFLFAKGIGVPKVIAYDLKTESAILEDLGRDTLYTLLVQEKNREKITSLYFKTLEALAEMQIKGKEGIEQCSVLRDRIFDYKSLRGETEYFKISFLKRYCGLELTQEAQLNKEFEELARLLASEPLFFMHRDFQSQNIHFKEGKIRIVDFQTAHQGMLYYDAASLLRDAYIDLDEDFQMKLLRYYVSCLKGTWGMNLNVDEFVEKFYLAGLQRNMQALGAFGFLTLEKGKKEFASHIPAALTHLKNALEKFPQFQELRATLLRIPSHLTRSR